MIARGTLHWAVAAVAIAAVGASVALAAIPDQDGIIHGCYRNAAGPQDDRAGDLRVIDPGPARRACEPDETPLNWSQGGLPRVHQATASASGWKPADHEREVLNAVVPTGLYSINAKTTVTVKGKGTATGAKCKLLVDGQVQDRAEDSTGRVTTLPLQFAGEVRSRIALKCRVNNLMWRGVNPKIAALAVGQVTG